MQVPAEDKSLTVTAAEAESRERSSDCVESDAVHGPPGHVPDPSIESENEEAKRGRERMTAEMVKG